MLFNDEQLCPSLLPCPSRPPWLRLAALLLLLVSAGFALPHADAAASPRLFLPLVGRSDSPPPRIYQDTFENTASGWPVAETEQVRVGYQGGEYEILLRVPNWGAAVLSPLAPLWSYRVEADARLPAGSDALVALIFDQLDWDHFYIFAVVPDDQIYALFRVEPYALVPLIDWRPSAVISPAGTNRLGVARAGERIDLSINRLAVDVAFDVTYLWGRLGFYTENAAVGPVASRYDTFTAWQPAAGAVAPAGREGEVEVRGGPGG